MTKTKNYKQMKRTYLFLVFLAFGLGSISAQSFVGKLNQNPTPNLKKFTSDDTLRILAVMSDFQKDIDDATFGDGKFGTIYSQDYGNSILDPLPHDKAYFENHLKFVQNYYNKVSDSKLNISYKVLDEIVTVSKTMRNYTPPLDDVSNLTPLGEYAEEVWQLADQKYPNIDFSKFDLFFVLHAGVGKDVSLPGSLGNERDLPSVYLNQKSLQNIFGQDFDGFPVGNGSFKITNSAILPETESREIEGYSGITLIELTTNGLIAATVGSYLGLPDLFNTETGRSAIGRFGLMDGQSMFTYQGIFPPEPSAWEKIFLGWVTPTEISIGDAKLNLVNRYVANPTDTTLIKIPINATEYYLIENRKRDALKDGSIVTYISNGQTFTKTFDKDYENYIYYSVDTLKGVIIDVDEFDWALPGDDRKSTIETFDDIGLIIWHIDEKIIEDNYESNTINNDRYTRGIAIVEADGIRDIGETFQTVFGETVIGEGTKEDTWYKKNPGEYYENKFSADTKPKAESNTKANSLITLNDFSEISNRMSFNLAYGSENIDLIGNVKFETNFEVEWLSSIFNGNETVHFASYRGDIYKFDSWGNIKYRTKNRVKPNDESYSLKSAIVGMNGKEILIKMYNQSVLVYFSENDTYDLILTILAEDTYTTSPVIVFQTDSVIEFLIGTKKGKINKYSIDIVNRTIVLMESNNTFDIPVKQIGVIGNGYNAISEYYYFNSLFNEPMAGYFIEREILQLANTAENVAILLTTQGFYNILSKYEINNQIVEANSITSFSLADLKKDGDNYIIHNGEQNLNAFNLSGVTATNFPIQDEFDATFTSSPLAVDLNNDDAADIISFTTNGKIIAVDGITGKMIDGFPISSGGKVATTPTIFTENGRTAIGIITENNQFMSWNISQYDGKKFWTEENGNASNTSSVGAASSSEVIADFFPQSKAYNWPNPVYDGVTNIRYFVSEDSKAEVTIFDLAGDLVAKLSGIGIGGFDNEVVWNVNNIQSGVYFAHLEVTSNSGKTDTKIIKIAVIK